MRVYNIVLVTVAVIVFFSNDVIAATSAQDISLAPVNNEVKTARFLRSGNEAATFEEEDTLTEDEDRMYGLEKLTSQMSFLKLRMQANKAMKDVALAAEKEAKAAAKLADKQAREAAKRGKEGSKTGKGGR
ncbi:unnamed protein product [Phytophthora lilii]|uniref:RxLR effector protein n=1 Tax=Phytophthora lilii TaxID=2077276 RepID=A0A9W6UF07_9STRA|nr:unnamed protein product [Phytophthora lilii]